MPTMNEFRERLHHLGFPRATVRLTIHELHKAGLLARAAAGRGKERDVTPAEAAIILVALCNPTTAGCAEMVRKVGALPMLALNHVVIVRGATTITDTGNLVESGEEFTSLHAPFLDVLTALISPAGGGLPFQPDGLTVEHWPVPKATVGIGIWQAESGALCKLEAAYGFAAADWTEVAEVMKRTQTMRGASITLHTPTLRLVRQMFEAEEARAEAAPDCEPKDPTAILAEVVAGAIPVPSAR